MTFKRLLAAGLAATTLLAGPAGAQEETIKVGILHSLSGTMAISETTLKDVMLMLIEEQNKKGGVLGKKLEPVVVDPASNWPLFAEKARELIAIVPDSECRMPTLIVSSAAAGALTPMAIDMLSAADANSDLREIAIRNSRRGCLHRLTKGKRRASP